MKTSLPSSPRGQALVLIVLAAVGLFAFAALAIDGSAVFSDRRHAQNAADTAGYAAALARVRAPTGPWKQSGIDRAIVNGYDASDGVTEVLVYLCSEWPTAPENTTAESCKGLPASADLDDYVYVRIKSVVNLTFARVIGWQQVTNYTDAVVRAVLPEVTEWFDGKALVSTKKDCPRPGDNFVPFVAGGSGSAVVMNSGIFVNANCPESFVDNGGGSVSTDPNVGICLVGGYDDSPPLSGITPLPTEDCGSQVEISDYWMPDANPPNLLAPYCSSQGRIDDLGGGNYEAWPGWFDKTGNKTFPDASPAGTLKLNRGIYCLYNGISLNASWTITTDLNGDGQHNSTAEGVFFYIPGGDVTFNGGSTLTLHALDSTSGGYDSRLLKYLIYIPPSNEAVVNISGNNGSTFTGTVLAPTSHLTIDGSGNAFDLHTQIITYNTTITGGGNISIIYDPDDNAPAIKQGNLSPTE